MSQGACAAGAEGAEYWGNGWSGQDGEYSYANYSDGQSYGYAYVYDEVHHTFRWCVHEHFVLRCQQKYACAAWTSGSPMAHRHRPAGKRCMTALYKTTSCLHGLPGIPDLPTTYR